MNKNLRKAMYTRSRLQNRYFKDPSLANKVAYKKQINKCVSLRRKSIKNYFSKLSSKNLANSKGFWNMVKTFLTNKGLISNRAIVLIEKEKVPDVETNQASGTDNNVFEIQRCNQNRCYSK